MGAAGALGVSREALSSPGRARRAGRNQGLSLGTWLAACSGLAGLGNAAFLSRPILHRAFVFLFGDELLIYNWLWFPTVKGL